MKFNRLFKVVCTGMVSLTLAFSLTACGSGQGASKQTIAVIVKSQNSAYWDSLKLGVDDAAGETGYNIDYSAPETEADLDQQKKLIQDAVSKKVKAIVIAPIDAEALNEDLAQADAANIPVICVDSDCSFVGKKTFISSNNANAGSIEGRHAGEILMAKGGGTIAIVGHTKGAGNANGRIGGFIDTLVNDYGASVEELSPDQFISASNMSYYDAISVGRNVAREKGTNIKIVDLQYCDAKLEVARDNTNKFLDTYPDLSLIFATNQQTTLGALEVIKQRGLDGKITFLGFDSGEEQVKGIESGAISGLIAQSPYNMGYLGVRYANKCVNNEKIPSLVDTGVTFVEKSNLNDEEIKLLLNPETFESYNKTE